MYDIRDNDGNVLTGMMDIKDVPAASKDDESRLTVGYIISQMEKIRADSEYVYEALKQIKEIETHPPSMNAEDSASRAKADAIGDIVKSREETNHRLLAMYKSMYDDLMPKPEGGVKGHDKVAILKQLAEMVEDNDILSESLGGHFDTILKEILK